MSNEALAAVLASTSAVLLDFDGPICSVFSAFSPAAVAEELRARLRLVDAPKTSEPFEILSYVARTEPSAAARAETELARLETRAVAEATPTPGAAAVLQHFDESGRRVVVVSNNSAVSVRAYLYQHHLAGYVAAVSSRLEADPNLLKPHPHLLFHAAELLNLSVRDCAMVGDSSTDIEAARAAGARVIAYANKPAKRDRFERLRPDAIIDDMAELICVRAPS
ncbi:HAD family hydrolase [Amycolatopsis sp. K13G38]|uniref:HAD family hydrolase n=1 Tax=Amycolatopsis acididurans TaxID=2724524 RepID=A0ABX1JBF1_9PSEU|nr:HAD-IA family hydrolase [Amycolatopsis acididurans]NKQ57122.1 HAD family hydrolase [Amycolatopsis acididurans]